MTLTWIDILDFKVRVIIITSILFLVSFNAFGQASSRFQSDLFIGGNYTSVYLDGEWLDQNFRPSAGWWGEQFFHPKFSMNYSASLFMKSSRVTPSVNIEWIGLDITASPTYNFGDFGIFLGARTTVPFSFYYKNKGFIQTREFPDSIYIRAFSLNAGIQLKLHDYVKLVLSHNIALGNYTEKNFHIGIRIPMGKSKVRRDSYRDIKQKAARTQILDLHQGALLVKLSEGNAKYNALNKLGRDRKAELFKERLREDNLRLMNAFKSQYDFSQVYFFYSSNSNKVLEGELKGVFLNDSLSEDSNILIPEGIPIYLAGLSTRRMDSIKNFDSYENRTVGSFEQKRETTYHGVSEIGFTGLFIYDSDFNQLSRPFPYYVRYIGGHYRHQPDRWIFLTPNLFSFGSLSIEHTVKVLNRKLWWFWKLDPGKSTKEEE